MIKDFSLRNSKFEARNSAVLYSCYWVAQICVFAAALFFPDFCEAAVTGLCADCHTMHNSSEGVVVAFTRDSSGNKVLRELAFNKLLKTDCIGCHTHTGSETILTMGETRIPIVLNMVEPAYPPNGSVSSTLAGGNFHWVAQVGDQYGHNVYGISGGDFRFPGLAPGGTVEDQCATCHQTLASPQSGCTGCHVTQHHIDGDLVTGPDGEWYRFLGSVMQRTEGPEPTPEGVVGIEDPDWEKDPLSNRHNTYQGSTAQHTNYLNTRSIDQKCAGCHGRFHSETASNGVWIRHPVDVTIPDSGEYTGFTTYNPLAPVARQSITAVDANFTNIDRGSDLVSCISCHRPHGSPYPAMLRWAYRAWPGDDPHTGQPAVNGCAVCHTTKD